MRALVTGAGGFCGRHLLQHLQSTGVETHTTGPRPVGGRYHPSTPSDLSTLTTAVAAVRPDCVFHLAGISARAEWPDYYRINVQYAVHLLQALSATGQHACPVLLVGTSAEYGVPDDNRLPITEALPARPYSHYGVSKLAQTLMGATLAAEGRPVIMVRPFNIIGPGMPDYISVEGFARQATEIVKGRRPPVLYVGNLDAARDFSSVHDVVSMYARLMQTPRAFGEVVNVCSGHAVGIREVLNRLLALAGCAIEVRTDPERYKAVDVPVHYGSPAKLESLIGSVSRETLDATLAGIWQEAMARP